MTKKEFIRDLEKNIYCWLMPSPVHGIGVFAIRDIRKGIHPFQGCRAVSWSTMKQEDIFGNPKIDEAVKDMVRRFYITEGDIVHIPNHSLNDINISYFVNHSAKPNVAVREYDDHIEFIADRNIEKGQELLVDYRTYIEGWKEFPNTVS